MSLCETCASLPIRKIVHLLRGGETAFDSFDWFPVPDSRPEETAKRPFVKWFNDLDSLRAEKRQCEFCCLLVDSVALNINHVIEKYHDAAVWLQLPNPHGTPEFSIVIGFGRPTTRISGNFRFTTLLDSPVAKYFSDHVIIADALHPMVLGTIKSWTDDCNEKHSKCARPQRKKMLSEWRETMEQVMPNNWNGNSSKSARSKSVPSRLLDLSTMSNKQDFDLHKSNPRELLAMQRLRLTEDVSTNHRYAALSYCWGPPSDHETVFKTTKNSLKLHKKRKGITYQQLPKTLQDAVYITRYLGLDYLWVDRLCIVQGDTSDWEREAAKMADVYSGAYITISATRAAHADEGFLGPRKVPPRQRVSFSDNEGQFDLYFTYDDLLARPGSTQSLPLQPLRLQNEEPLLDRAWCFQERVLASRTIHFGSAQMYWECAHKFEEEQCLASFNEITAYQEYSIERIAAGLMEASSSRNPDKSRDAWYRLVREYTSRDMTKMTDKLPALSGVISALQEKLPGDICYAGIWQSWFLRGLLWRLQVPEHDLYVFKSVKPHRVDWRAPSWSFASVEGVILYNNFDHSEKREEIATLVGCELQLKGANPSGELAGGSVSLRGPLVPVLEVSLEPTRKGRACTITLLDGRNVGAYVFFDVEYHESCKAVMLTPHAGLVITSSGAHSSTHTYTRVGVISISPLWDGVEMMRCAHRPERWLSADAYPSPTLITLL